MRSPAGLFGTHVPQGADEISGCRHAGIGFDLGQSEVGDPDLSVGVEQQIGRLDIAMDHAVFVRIGKSTGDLASDPGDPPESVAGFGFGRGQSQVEGRGGVSAVRRVRVAGCVAIPVGENDREVSAFDEPHGVVMDAAVASDAVDIDDVRVIELGGSEGFVPEPLQAGLVDQGSQRQNLEGDASTEGDLFGLVDDAHAASSKLPDDPKVAELPGGHPLRRLHRLIGPGGQVVHDFEDRKDLQQ